MAQAFGQGGKFGEQQEFSKKTKTKPVMFNGEVVGHMLPAGVSAPHQSAYVAPKKNYGVVAAFFVAAALLLFAWSAFAQSSAPTSQQENFLQLETQALELAGTALLALLVWLSGKANVWISAHAKGAAAQYGASVFSKLSAQALTAVQAVEQIAQQDLKNGVGKATAAQLKLDALAYLKTYIGPQGLAELASIVGLDQVAQVLSTHVEAAVLQVNQAQPVTLAPAK